MTSGLEIMRGAADQGWLFATRQLRPCMAAARPPAGNAYVHGGPPSAKGSPAAAAALRCLTIDTREKLGGMMEASEAPSMVVAVCWL